MILTIAINIINMVLSYILVIQFDYGIQGVAWGTVIAQYAGLIFAIGLMIFKYRSYLVNVRISEMIQIEAFKDFLRINKDIFLRSIFLTIAFAFFYSQSSEGGELVLAGNYLLLLFLNWMSYGIDGFAYASESLVGKYYGAKNESKSAK